MTWAVAALSPKPLVGVNSRLMRKYVEYVADFLLKMLGINALYGSNNPVSSTFSRRRATAAYCLTIVSVHGDVRRRREDELLRTARQ